LLKLRAGAGQLGRLRCGGVRRRPAASPNTPSNPTARPYTENLTGRADALNRLPETAWTPAYDGDGEPRDGPDVADYRAAEPDRMAGAHPRHRPPQSAAPRRAAAAGRHDGRRITCFPPTPAAGNCPNETAAPPPRQRRRPHPLRQRHWPANLPLHDAASNAVWLTIVLLAYHPAHLDPNAVIGAAAGGRTQDTAAAAARHRRAPDPIRAANPATAGRPWAATVTAAVARCAPSPTPADNTAPAPTTRDHGHGPVAVEAIFSTSKLTTSPGHRRFAVARHI
jgi:hypothetical protein